MVNEQAKNQDMNRNPTGKGGFGDNPQHRANGRWNKEESISYWYNKLLRMPDKEYEAFKPANKSQRIAKGMLDDADSKRPDIVREITDRTEGKAPQSVIFDDVTPNRPLKGATAEELREALKIRRADNGKRSSD